MFIKGILLAFVVCVLDQLHKYYMIEVFDIANNQFVVTPFFDMVMVWNYGISFGLFQNPGDGKYAFVLISTIICIILLVWLKKNDSKFLMWALGSIIGGAVGNAIDRLNYGAVADFFSFHIGQYYWPAFNIADIAVFIGATMIVIHSLFLEDKGRNHENT